MISEAALRDFKKIWKEEFGGEEISDKLATEEAANLLTLFNAIFRPVKKDWAELADQNKLYHTKSKRN